MSSRYPNPNQPAGAPYGHQAGYAAGQYPQFYSQPQPHSQPQPPQPQASPYYANAHNAEVYAQAYDQASQGGGYAGAAGYNGGSGGAGAPPELYSRMGGMSLGGGGGAMPPLPPGYAGASASGLVPGGGGYGPAAPAAVPVSLPRPNFESDAVLSRLHGLDAPQMPQLTSTSSAAAPRQQLDAYGRPIAGAISTTSEVEWPQPAACPPHLFRPASTRSARMCVNAFPGSSAIAKKYALPLGVVLQPMAESGEPTPVVNFGAAGIVRCTRCRSYINFMCAFSDAGRAWRCSICRHMNEIPSEYFCPIEQSGYRRDVAQRFELCCGSVEFVAPPEYMVRSPMPPVYVFLLEVSPVAVASGVFEAAVASIRESIDGLPQDERTMVGLVTFDTAVHFHVLRGTENAQPAVVTMPDIEDVFLPAPDDLLVPFKDVRGAFERLLEALPSMYASGASDGAAAAAAAGGVSSYAASAVGSVFGAAVQSAQELMKSTGGKLICVLASRPKLGPGALKDRSDNTAVETDRERLLLSPDSAFYKQKAVDCTRHQISVDVLLCGASPGVSLDVASLAPLVRYSGGELAYYPSFDVRHDGFLMVETLRRVIARETAWEAVMRVRASKGVRCSTFHGRFFLRSTDLLALPATDTDKAFAIEFGYDENILDGKAFCVQAALLFTNSRGERRIRVHTLCIPVVGTVAELVRRCDAGATAHVLLRRHSESLRDKRPEDVRRALMDTLVSAMAVALPAARALMQTQQPMGGLMGGNQQPSPPVSDVAAVGTIHLPEAMALLPLYVQGMLKSPLFSRDAYVLFSMRTDDKSALMHALNATNVPTTQSLMYPLILPLYPLDDYPDAGVYTEDERGLTSVALPPALPAQMSTLRQDSTLLLYDGMTTIVWMGAASMVAFGELIAGAEQSTDPYAIFSRCLYGDSSGEAGRVRAIVRNVRGMRGAGAPLHIVPQGSPMQARVDALMVEDRSASRPAYADFLADMQKQISLKSVKAK